MINLNGKVKEFLKMISYKNKKRFVNIVVLLVPILIINAQTDNNNMVHIPVKNGELEYEIQGEGEPVLFIHGSHIAATFLTLMSEPSLSDYQLIRYHRQGFAGSSFPKVPFSIQDQAADVVALLTHLEIEKAHIVGHSYGGDIALQLSLDYPEFVHSIILLEPAIVNLPGVTMNLEQFNAAITQYESGDTEGAVDTFATWVIGKEWQNELEKVNPGGSKQAKRDGKNFFEVEVPALNQWQFGAEEAAKISQPVLYIMGSLSLPEMTACKPFLQSWIPQLEDHTVNNVNHALHTQAPEEIANTISEFIQRHTF